MLVEINSLSLRRNQNVRAKQVDTPIDRITVLLLSGESYFMTSDHIKHRLDGLSYLITAHPDIAYAVSIVSQLIHTPRIGWPYFLL